MAGGRRVKRIILSTVAVALAIMLPACARSRAGRDDVDVGPWGRSLSSLKQLAAHPLYSMHYYAPYPGEETAAQLDASAWGCSLFAALGSPGEGIYGRNFDWDHSPALVLFTYPADGYASVSMVDLAYLLDEETCEDLTNAPAEDLAPLRNAPFLPFDGMNEQGLVIGMAAVEDSPVPYDPAKQSRGSLGIIREMLDHAGTAEEALALMGQYNIDTAGGPHLHYLIADAEGHAVLVELYEGELRALSSSGPWHEATNFTHSALDSSDLTHRCWRYDRIQERLSQTQGKLTAAEAMRLLEDVAQPSTQWSAVYHLGDGTLYLAMGQDYSRIYSLSLRSEP